ncbi:MAG: hypothetical protein R3200_08170, partial [Xanthomonadales bacterium]|nr:hypothetical protein [Xanthomonadales bacterium]
YCGLRGFTKTLYEELELKCTGMEFAVEMIVKASLHRARFGQVPVTLHRDARVQDVPHLRTFRDGWRTLRFFLLHSPRWLFWVPGMLLMLLGVLGYGLALPAVQIGDAVLGVHTLLVASLALLLGFQLITTAVSAKLYALQTGMLPPDPDFESWLARVGLEHGLVVSMLIFLAGVAAIGVVGWRWFQADFGSLDYPESMRWVIPGVTACALGFQGLFTSFFLGVLRIDHR